MQRKEDDSFALHLHSDCESTNGACSGATPAGAEAAAAAESQLRLIDAAALVPKRGLEAGVAAAERTAVSDAAATAAAAPRTAARSARPAAGTAAVAAGRAGRPGAVEPPAIQPSEEPAMKLLR